MKTRVTESAKICGGRRKSLSEFKEARDEYRS